MIFVDRKTFLTLPPGTVYTKYNSGTCDHLAIKQDNCGSNDWFYLPLDSINTIDIDCSGELWSRLSDVKPGDTFNIEFDRTSRDGCFDDDEKFFIYTPDDIKKLITTLTNTLKD